MLSLFEAYNIDTMPERYNSLSIRDFTCYAKFHYCLSVITIATNLLCVHTCSWFPEPVYKLLSVLCLPASNHSIKTCLKLTVVLECLIVLFLFILSSSVWAGGHLGSGKQLLCQSFFAV